MSEEKKAELEKRVQEIKDELRSFIVDTINVLREDPSEIS